MIGTQNTTDVELPTNQWSVREASGYTDAHYLVTQWHHYFGVELEDNRLPLPLAEVAGWNDDEDRETVLGLVAEHTPRDRDHSVAVGGALAWIRPHDETVEELPDGRYDPDALAGERNAWLLFGIVDPAWRGRGIGREMFRRRQEWAKLNGAGMMLSFGWERESGLTSRPLFESEEWVPIQRLGDHYSKTRPSCPDCGAWQHNDVKCSCDTTLWAKDVSYE